jgi:hypothetical protein
MMLSHEKKIVFLQRMKIKGKYISKALSQYISINLINSEKKEEISPTIILLMELGGRNN